MSLEEKIAEVRRVARQSLVIYGLSCVAAIVLAAILALSLVDYAVKLEDRGIRAMFSLTALGIFGWAFYRFVWVTTRWRMTDVAVAQHIERRFPALADRLSTTVEFLNQDEDDPFAGSASLRRAVVTSTCAEVEALDFTEAIESRPMKRAMRWAGLAFFCAVVLVMLNPLAARVAIARLVRPFGNDAWPRRNELAFAAEPPKRIAVGQTFEVNVIDRKGRLPDEAQIHYRYDPLEGDSSAGEERSEPMQRLNDVLVARQENVVRPFSFRISGGDDNSMEWQRLEVVEPPRIESMKVTLRPPGYTGWPAVSSDRHIQALRGTRVEIAATVTKRLKSAKLVQESGTTLEARIGPDGVSIAVPATAEHPLTVDKSGAYWFELVDDENLTGGTQDRWEIRAVSDSPPSVAIEHPSSNQFLTPGAEVPLRVLVKDDLAIKDVTLKFTRSAEATGDDMQVVPYQGPAKPTVESQRDAVPHQGETRTINYLWQLAALDLKPGMQVTFYATANDYLPQAGKSPERRITIITPRELEDRIAQRQALILGELGRVLKLEQDTRAQVNELQIQLEKVGKLEKQDIDHTQGAELNQRQVARTLTGETEGLPAQINDLLGELKSNKIDNPDVERRMQTMLDELNRLGKDHLGPLERELTSVIKGAQVELGKPAPTGPKDAVKSPVGKSLVAAARHQDEVIRTLEKLTGDMSQWDNYRRFGREISQFKRDTEEIEEQTARVGAKTFGKERKDLTPQQQADLSKLAERERELARRFDKVQQQMAEVGRSLQDDDPLAAATLGDAANQARDRGISGRMREGGKQLEENQVGQATQQQQQVKKDLDELLDILSNRREQELSRLVKRLKEAEGELENIRKQQEGLRKKFEAAKEIENPSERRRQLERLSREEKKLQEKSQRFARKLERLQAEKAGRSTADAASKMAKSGAAGEKGDPGEAGDQAELAQKDLDEAQQELAERRKQAEADLAREQIAKMQDGIKSLHERQTTLLAETERLENLRAAQGRFTRPQLSSVRDLARAEMGLRAESRALAERVAAAQVFHLALETIGREMGRAADAIEQQETGNLTQTIEKDVLRRLAQLITALKSTAKPPGDGNAGGNGGGQGGEKEAAQDSIRALAEVKLLRLMQQDVNDRFLQLAEGRDRRSPEARASEFESLKADQGKLAELMQNFARPPADTPEDDPEKLPDLRLEK